MALTISKVIKMSRTTIRKNASKKINAFLNSAVGILAKVSHSDMSDSFNDEYSIVAPGDVQSWLSEHDNYVDAQVYLDDDGSFVVRGPYYFCDKFTAYFSNESFELAQQQCGLVVAAPVAGPVVEFSGNVVSLCAFRALKRA